MPLDVDDSYSATSIRRFPVAALEEYNPASYSLAWSTVVDDEVPNEISRPLESPHERRLSALRPSGLSEVNGQDQRFSLAWKILNSLTYYGALQAAKAAATDSGESEKMDQVLESLKWEWFYVGSLVR